MRNVTVNPVDKTTTAQGGCLLADVDVAAGAHGLVTAGGAVNHTGIGGPTLGGGYRWLCDQQGLTFDNLLSVQTVLANGSTSAPQKPKTPPSSRSSAAQANPSA